MSHRHILFIVSQKRSRILRYFNVWRLFYTLYYFIAPLSTCLKSIWLLKIKHNIIVRSSTLFSWTIMKCKCLRNRSTERPKAHRYNKNIYTLLYNLVGIGIYIIIYKLYATKSKTEIQKKKKIPNKDKNCWWFLKLDYYVIVLLVVNQLCLNEGISSHQVCMTALWNPSSKFSSELAVW